MRLTFYIIYSIGAMTRSLASLENNRAPAAKIKQTKKVVAIPKPLCNRVLFLRSKIETKVPSSIETTSFSLALNKFGSIPLSQTAPLALSKIIGVLIYDCSLIYASIAKLKPSDFVSYYEIKVSPN